MGTATVPAVPAAKVDPAVTSVSAEREPDRAACAQALAQHLGAARGLREAAASDPQRADRRRALRAFQAARLAATHADLVADARYATAIGLFLQDLYGPKDIGARDAEMLRVLPVMTATLPGAALRALQDAALLDAMAERFDAAMVQVLGPRLDAPLQPADYAAAWREVGDRPGRLQQIALVGEIGRMLDDLARRPGLAMLLKVMRKPARLAGLSSLQTFLEHGFEAFRSMKHADEFLARVDSRERALALALFDGSDGLHAFAMTGSPGAAGLPTAAGSGAPP